MMKMYELQQFHLSFGLPAKKAGFWQAKLVFDSQGDLAKAGHPQN